MIINKQLPETDYEVIEQDIKDGKIRDSWPEERRE